MMTKTKTPPRCTTTGTAKKQSIAKSSNCILSLKRAAVKLAITADLVLLLVCARFSQHPRHRRLYAGAQHPVRADSQAGGKHS